MRAALRLFYGRGAEVACEDLVASRCQFVGQFSPTTSRLKRSSEMLAWKGGQEQLPFPAFKPTLGGAIRIVHAIQVVEVIAQRNAR